MRNRKLPETAKKRFNSSPVHPEICKLRLNHSSQRVLFSYSIIETTPVNYMPDLIPKSIKYTGIITDSGCSDLSVEDLTMKDPDAYLRCMWRLSETSEIHQSRKIFQSS